MKQKILTGFLVFVTLLSSSFVWANVVEGHDTKHDVKLIVDKKVKPVFLKTTCDEAEVQIVVKAPEFKKPEHKDHKDDHKKDDKKKDDNKGKKHDKDKKDEPKESSESATTVEEETTNDEETTEENVNEEENTDENNQNDDEENNDENEDNSDQEETLKFKATNVKVTDIVSDNVTFIGGTDFPDADNITNNSNGTTTLEWSLGELEPGEVKVLKYKIKPEFAGNDISVGVYPDSIVTYTDAEGNQQTVKLPKAKIKVLENKGCNPVEEEEPCPEDPSDPGDNDHEDHDDDDHDEDEDKDEDPEEDDNDDGRGGIVLGDSDESVNRFPDTSSKE